MDADDAHEFAALGEDGGPMCLIDFAESQISGFVGKAGWGQNQSKAPGPWKIRCRVSLGLGGICADPIRIPHKAHARNFVRGQPVKSELPMLTPAPQAACRGCRRSRRWRGLRPLVNKLAVFFLDTTQPTVQDGTPCVPRSNHQRIDARESTTRNTLGEFPCRSWLHLDAVECLAGWWRGILKGIGCSYGQPWSVHHHRETVL